VLKVVPTDGDWCVRFEHIDYVPLEKMYFESLSILKTDSQGQKINFASSDKPTYVNLHFKKLHWKWLIIHMYGIKW